MQGATLHLDAGTIRYELPHAILYALHDQIAHAPACMTSGRLDCPCKRDAGSATLAGG